MLSTRKSKFVTLLNTFESSGTLVDHCSDVTVLNWCETLSLARCAWLVHEAPHKPSTIQHHLCWRRLGFGYFRCWFVPFIDEHSLAASIEAEASPVFNSPCCSWMSSGVWCVRGRLIIGWYSVVGFGGHSGPRKITQKMCSKYLLFIVVFFSCCVLAFCGRSVYHVRLTQNRYLHIRHDAAAAGLLWNFCRK